VFTIGRKIQRLNRDNIEEVTNNVEKYRGYCFIVSLPKAWYLTKYNAMVLNMMNQCNHFELSFVVENELKVIDARAIPLGVER
jgi:hypothetical protein